MATADTASQFKASRQKTGDFGISRTELYLFNRGELFHSYRIFGAHPMTYRGRRGVRFAVWAPNARSVRVVGNFNGWDGSRHPMRQLGTTGVWATFVPGLDEGALYKYEIETPDGRRVLKADPFAFRAELRPNTASIVVDLANQHAWRDERWRREKRKRCVYREPVLIYEVHLGSWKNRGEEQFYTYDEIADDLLDYVCSMGYTHIELLPIAEHPLDASWGYQVTGYYAATSRYGTPGQLMELIDRCHERGIGVIVDWVPAHFCKDDHGLRLFDGTPIYEGSDPNRAEKPLWGTLMFDYGRTEVQSFLISNALFWMDVYHVDGLRIDAVASMIDLNFDKPEHMRTFNRRGGTENDEAIAFLKKLNEVVFRYYPDALMIAEDSSAWPGVTAPTHTGGLGFNFKWNMGWMNDSLRYMALPPSERPHHHHLMTFSLLYAYSENFVLPLSHDEVVHGKRSLLNKMPGGYEDKFANLRAYYGYWMTHPGKKLLFMGCEFAQFDEWKDRLQLDWMLLDFDMHRKMLEYVRTLNRLYRSLPALWELDFDAAGFEWIDVHNAAQSVYIYFRRASDGSHAVAVCNFSDRFYERFRFGVPSASDYRIAINSDELRFGGRGLGLHSGETVAAEPIPWHGRERSLETALPPLSFLLLVPDSRKEAPTCDARNGSRCCSPEERANGSAS